MRHINSLPSPDDPDEALAAVVALRLMANKLERKAVKKAIDSGWTWSEVAEALGVTKQAAHKRHANFISKKTNKKKGVR